jgi:hypothetical protein
MRTTLTTLVTVHGVGLLNKLIGKVRLFLAPDDIERLRQTTLSEEQRDEINQWHNDLHHRLMNNAAVETAHPTRTGDENEPEKDEDLDPSIDAVLLAQERGMPLLADDRFLQNILLNARQGAAGTAFGTDSLLAALAKAKQLTADEWANAFLQLIRWRYRFLVPPQTVLLTLAGRHLAFPPGAELRVIGRYLHDCCRDPGLFCGPEPTEPPVPVGLKYFQTAIQSIGRFLAHAWQDRRFEDRAIMAMTRWCVSEFIPTPPHHLAYGAGVLAAESVARLLMISLVGESMRSRDLERLNEAVVAVADVLRMSNEDFDWLMSQLAGLELDLLPAGSVPASMDFKTRRRIAFAAFRHRQNFGLPVAAELADLNLIERPIVPLNDSDIDAISDPNHPRRVANGLGPWVGIRSDSATTPNGAHYVPDLLFHPQPRLRSAALKFMHRVGPDGRTWLAPRTVALLQELAAAIGGEDAREARGAARMVQHAITTDFSAMLAAFRQSRLMQFTDENTKILKRLLAPGQGVLGSVPAESFAPPSPDDAKIDSNGPRLSIALDRYYERYGHLCLAGPFAVDAVVGDWIKRHGSDGVWNEVHTWSRDSTRPLKKYHASRVLLRFSEVVPELQLSAAWQEVRDVLKGYDKDRQSAPLQTEAWRMVHLLAAHYLQLLEIGSFEPDAAKLAAQAWWMAERVTQMAVETAASEAEPDQASELIRHVVQAGLVPELAKSSLSVLLGRPIREPSLAAFATERLNSMWSVGLLEVEPGGLAVPDEVAESLVHNLLLCLALDFPPPDGSEKERVWAVAANRAPCVAKWNRIVIPECADNEDAHAPTEKQAETAVPDHTTLPEAFRNVASASNDVQMFVLNRVRVAIAIGSLKPEDVSWLTEDIGWFDDVFRLLPFELFRSLGDSLLGLLRVAEDEWKVKMPHLLRVQAERRELEIERRFQAATMVLYASAVIGRVGALVAMIEALEGDELRDKMDAWHTRLNQIRENAPVPIQGKLRDILAHLAPPAEAGPISASTNSPK